MLDKTTQSAGTGERPIRTADTICSAPSHETPAHSAGLLPVGLPNPKPCEATAPLQGKSRTARNRKRPKKRGRKKSKAWSLTSRYLRSHCPEYLRRTEVVNLIQADQHAARIGNPLTTFISIRWAHTAQGDANIKRRWSALLNALRIWSDRQGFEWVALGVHENPEGKFNSHLLCNIPNSLLGVAAEWLVKQLGGSVGAVHLRPRVCPGWEGDQTLRYMLKGCDPQTARRYGIVYRNQGTVRFRRCTTTRNINATARREFSDTVKRGGWEFRDQYRAREGNAA